MAGTLNVNRSVDDVFYRYKMPKLIAKVEGKGNGIKTVIANMTEIAKALNRPPTYPTKYFGCELGAQTQFDMKNERFIVNGEHDAAKLQNLLDGFIKKFVLCPECENPETTLTVKKNQITQACKACGNKGMIDPRQKLTTFIIKCPPTEEANGTGADAPTTPAVKEKRSAKKDAKKGHHSPTTVGVDDVRNGSNGAAADGVADEELEATPPLENGSRNGSEEEDDDGDWVVDPNAETERQKSEITNAMSALLMNADLEKSVEERLEMFERFAQKQKKMAGGKLLDAKVLVNEAKRLDVKEKAALVLSGVIFDENIMLQIAAANNVLLHFTKDSKRAQKYLLGGIEQVVVKHKALLPKTAHVLKAFYDADVLEEATILEWAAKPSKKYVTKEENKEIIVKAEPFLKWLREAESESDENEEDDVEIVYAPGGKGTTANNAVRVVTKSGEDDFNIDDI